MTVDIGKEIFDGIVRGQRFAAEAERSFQDADAARRRGGCWGCQHRAHGAGACEAWPRFTREVRCRCDVQDGQL